MEIERKFTIKELPKDIESYDHHIIEQAYLTVEPAIRVRREDDRYYMTYKGTTGDNSALAHEEYNLPLTKEAYETLSSKADGVVIRKKRVLIPYGGHTIELDIFDEPFKPLVIAEVEFDSVDAADDFTPPDWFLSDVTGQKEYSNACLSRKTFV
ncbi:MAG: CYTH domain-containing protein [Lachnospiraceae bacterium]|nr:CYTH domain-containing protein [Lachnospiraceae bacterium]